MHYSARWDKNVLKHNNKQKHIKRSTEWIWNNMINLYIYKWSIEMDLEQYYKYM